MVPIPDRKTPSPKHIVMARHPINQRLYRRMQYPIRGLVVIFTPNGHADPIAA